MKIISGGQTGVDRAALDAAMATGITHGGWCPRGRLAEDGIIPAHYQLCETESTEYAVRTERNVVDSDATLLLCRGPLTGGTELTRRLAIKHKRPHLIVNLLENPQPSAVADWLKAIRAVTLNVAGPRESQNPGIAKEAKDFLVAVFARWHTDG